VIREIENVKEAHDAIYVRLDVMPMLCDPAITAGTVYLSDPRPGHIGSHFSACPMEVETARSLAWKIAREQGVENILIRDRKNLFPKSRRAECHYRVR
jgi:hypothetical protein